MEDSRTARCRLLDFYGALLTDKQRECFELHYDEDLSLSEIAEQSGISRQGVWDNIRRADMTLQETEEKTGLIRRFSKTEGCLKTVRAELEKLCKLCQGEALATARRALNELDALNYED